MKNILFALFLFPLFANAQTGHFQGVELRDTIYWLIDTTIAETEYEGLLDTTIKKFPLGDSLTVADNLYSTAVLENRQLARAAKRVVMGWQPRSLWFATSSIYQAITGETLFKATARKYVNIYIGDWIAKYDNGTKDVSVIQKPSGFLKLVIDAVEYNFNPFSEESFRVVNFPFAGGAETLDCYWNGVNRLSPTYIPIEGFSKLVLRRKKVQ